MALAFMACDTLNRGHDALVLVEFLAVHHWCCAFIEMTFEALLLVPLVY